MKILANTGFRLLLITSLRSTCVGAAQGLGRPELTQGCGEAGMGDEEWGLLWWGMKGWDMPG